ncbi:MAG TPA: hypothetical protein DCL73_14470 [Treponema sp.]|nr:hypothetical protein [Treponema sp.]
MEIRQLRYLIGLAKEENYLNAADEMYVSQSQLSKKIMQMEDELGVQLVDRSRRKICITEAGAVAVKYAGRIVSLYDEMYRELDAVKNKSENTLTIAAIPVLAPYRIPSLFDAFNKTVPHTKIVLKEAEGSAIISELAGGHTELGICRDVYINKNNFNFLPICDDKVVVIVSAGKKLAGKKEISVQDLHNEPFIFLDEQTMLHQYYMDICLKAGFIPDIVYTSKHPDDIVEMVAAGKGISFIMKKVFTYMHKDNILALSLTDPVKSQLGVVWQKSAKLSRKAELFTSFIHDNCMHEF